jgi:predicted membrane-bound spermidine synthase
MQTVSASSRTRKIEAERPRTIDTGRSANRRKRKTSRNSNSFAFAALLFCSGAAALVYQVLWIKQLSLIVGVDVYSVAIAVSAFFAGLALGSLIIGQWADRLKQPLLLYSVLEVGIALLGVMSTLLLGRAASLFAAAETHVGFFAWALPFALVGIPAFLMGGTLPVAIRSRSLGSKDIDRAGGSIYAANTAGGILGTLCCAFIFIRLFGVLGTALAAMTLNLISALLAFRLVRIAQDEKAARPVIERISLSRQAWVALVLYSVAGGVALGYEVVWSQAIVQFLTTRSFAFSIVLATYLAGLAFGSALYARYARKVSNPWGVFALLIAAAGLIAFAEIACLGLWQLQFQAAIGDLVYRALGDQFARMCARFAVAALGIVFLPTLLLGAAFPVALRLIVGERQVGQDIGVVIALNTAGGIAGTLVTGMLLVPRFGLVRTLGALAVLAGALGVIATLQDPAKHQRTRWSVVAIVIASLAFAIATPPNRLARLLTVTRGGSLVFYEESKAGTVAVVQQTAWLKRTNREPSNRTRPLLVPIHR